MANKVTVLMVDMLLNAKKIRKKLDENHITGIRRDVPDYSPTFNPVRSVITVNSSWWKFWTKKEKLIILLAGEPRAWEFGGDYVRDSTGKVVHGHYTEDPDNPVEFNSADPPLVSRYVTNVFGGLKERKEFTEKVAKKGIAERENKEDNTKMFFYPLLGTMVLLGAVVVLQILTMHGMKI
jgi:hypothetical protein